VADEAAQCGTPTLISPHAGAADEAIRDHCDGYVLPLERDRWVEKTLELLESPETWTKMSNNAHAHGLRLSPDRSAKGLVDAATFAIDTDRRSLVGKPRQSQE
jgi:glycosyltransferase involved in cell wall biosynthesis